ncbi:hypothetical protein SAMN05428953_12684 [Mesorhizobium muleiense]|uniref:Uncharacterized protein n=1 Tax=Mesorhizobium muleiense TaxID=1004279 RepID=A0A1G9H6P9_9HYPH|nr:hypothetical protein [Mesorhizobium muleiense]SDL08539.1 hypothetical protein SAMN05428953_12684 [Mesorhizobium muleiense]
MTAEELRTHILDTLAKRENVCRNAAVDPQRSKRLQQWEHGRADAYKDFREYLAKLDLRVSNDG